MKITSLSQRVDSKNVDPAKNVAIEQSNVVNLEKDEKKEPDTKNVKQAVDKLNKTARIFNKRFHFSIHEATHRVMVQVIDTETNKVINEFPPKKVLDLIASVEDLLGLVVDKKI